MSIQKNELAVGIDLGTTYSTVAYVDDLGSPRTVRNRMGDLSTPSALCIKDNELFFGKEAVKESIRVPDMYADSFKRDMGAICFCRKVCGHDVPPQVLSGLLLEHLMCDASQQLGAFRRAVISVPAYFDEARRRATQQAGQLAGLEVLDIINEPTAAALAYGAHKGISEVTRAKPIRVLIYDLGGGTFDVTILEITGSQFRTLATDGEIKLGGQDFDCRLVDFIADKFSQLHAVDLRTDPIACAQLWRDAQDAKHALSARQQTLLVVEYEDYRMRLDLHRLEFEQLIGDLIVRTEMTTRMMLNDAGLDWPQIDHVILTGGSTRIPAIGAMLERISGKTLDRSLSPDEAVAHGAALYANMLMKEHHDHSGGEFGLVNVNSHSLGLIGRDKKTGRKVVAPLIPKNTALPCTASEKFELARDDQRTILAQVVEGDSRRPEDCVPLGELVLRNLPPGLLAKTSVHVEFSYSSNGLLKVSARIPKARRTADVEIQRLQAERLDDLLTWRTRLLGGASAVGTKVDPGKNSFSEPSSVNDAHERLNVLYRVVGENAVGQSLPWILIIQKRTTAKAVASLAQLRAALQEIEEVNETAVTHADKIYAMGKLSPCRQKYREAESHATKLLAELGCKCADRNLMLPGTANEAAEICHLREWLAHVEDSQIN